MNEVEMQFLKSQFDLHTTPPEDALYSFSAMELTVVENMDSFIQSYGPLMKALDDKAVAAYFANWFSNVALALQYSISVFQTAIDIHLSNLSVHLIPSNGYCRIAFSLKEWCCDPAPADQKEREVWLNNVLTLFYRDTAAPLLNTMSEASTLGLRDVWGQFPTKFNYYLEDFAQKINEQHVLQRLQEDYNYLMNDLPSEIFGFSKNPFRVTVRRIEDLVDPSRTVQMRNRCCLYYQTEGSNYCYTCPRLKEEVRAARRQEYRERAASAEK